MCGFSLLHDMKSWIYDRDKIVETTYTWTLNFENIFIDDKKATLIMKLFV